MQHKQCHDFLSSLSEYIDGNLDHSICEEIEKHMANCPDCKIVFNTMRKTIDLYHQVDENTLIPNDALHRLHARLNLHNTGQK